MCQMELLFCPYKAAGQAERGKSRECKKNYAVHALPDNMAESGMC